MTRLGDGRLNPADGATSSAAGRGTAGMAVGKGPSDEVGAGDGIAGRGGLDAGGATGLGTLGAGALGIRDAAGCANGAGAKLTCGGGEFGLGAAGGTAALGASATLGVPDARGRSLSGRGGGGAGRARIVAGSIVRRKAGTGGIGGGMGTDGGSGAVFI